MSRKTKNKTPSARRVERNPMKRSKYSSFNELPLMLTVQDVADVLGIGLRHSVREYNGGYYGETHISEFEQVQPF